MTTTITDAYDLPRPEDIRAMGFVIRLRELDPASEDVRKLVADYVVTPAVAGELPRILDDMHQVFDRGEEYGRFIHGSFGSGKSHFMTILSLLFENVAAAWDKDSPVFGTLRDRQRTWIDKAHLLVVRIHMLSVKGKGTGLDRAVYDGFNQALRRRGKEPFEFLHVEGVLDEARREADLYGDAFWKGLADARVVGSRAEFEDAASASLRQRETLARAYLSHKGRDVASAGIDPNWSEGLHRLTKHAKDQGFGGVVLMIDELLLWLSEKSKEEFAREINDLAVLVDHNTGQRAVPLFVFVARQRNIKDFFPDLVDESRIHEHLEHHLKRFDETRLQDMELRHVVKGRVLKPRAEDAIRRASERLAQQHEKVLPGILAGADVAYLRDVYPFHPALIETLIDVTMLMQRERSALRVLYELLVIHYPHLPLGEFLPVGSAFDAIFPPSGVEASKKVEVLQDIHRQYYERLVPAMDQLRAAAGEFDDKRRAALDQIVKTVLLGEVSNRLRGKGLTVERLVQLNSVDVEGETYRGRLRVAAADLVTLSNLVPDLQVSSTDKTAIVRYVLGGVSLGEVLVRARSKVDNLSQRFRVFYGALKTALGVSGKKGFDDGADNVGDYEVRWRNTRRRGQLRIGNVREMKYEDFDAPDGGFTLLCDYPWDEPGHSVEEDRQRAFNVRKNRGNRYTLCWLPRHMSPTELDVIKDLAAVRFLLSPEGQEELLDTLAPQDRARLLDQAHGREKLQSQQLNELVREVYVNHGEWLPLVSDVDTKRPHEDLAANLEHAAQLLLDRRYPQHPTFGAEPRKADLERLLGWMVSAGDATVSVAFDDDTAKVLRTIGQPLELVNLGQAKASLRLDSRYIKDVLQRTDKDLVNWSEVSEWLREQYGLQPLIVDLFLAFLCQRDHRALNQVSGDPIDVTIGMPASVAIRLERGKLVGHAEWSRVRELCGQLLGLPQPAAQRSLQLQDRVASQMRERAIDRRRTLQGLHERLGQLGVETGARPNEIAEANARLAPLVESTSDSHKVLLALLAKWPSEADDPVRAVVQQVEGIRHALDGLDDGARNNLERARGHSPLGPRVSAHLDSLASHLGAANAQCPLTREWMGTWNAGAQALIAELITAPPEPPEPPGPRPPTPAPVPPSRQVFSATVNAGDARAVAEALEKARRKLAELKKGRVHVSITREDD
ncbi:MAG: hypothetical protein HYY06_10300 [Deltaproteobacteria bacterium]|nr:hypothetical protein [Deltaproteobacteria bacterium]